MDTISEIMRRTQGRPRTDEELEAYAIGNVHGFKYYRRETSLTPANIQEAYDEGYERGFCKADPADYPTTTSMLERKRNK